MRVRFGHVLHTWGAVALETALAEIASLGFEGVELFTDQVSAHLCNPAAFGALLSRHGLELSSLYLAADLVHPERAEDTVAKAAEAAAFLSALQAHHLIVGEGSGSVQGANYGAAADTLERMGRACLDHGVQLCFHPHMGSIVQTRAQIDLIFALTDPTCVFFCLDSGHVAKGGSDAVDVTRVYLARLRFVHLKDMLANGRFVELGRGIIDHTAILALLRQVDYQGWILPEVPLSDATAGDPSTSAAQSLRYLREALASELRG